ncbi:unnamed protein product [Paramecium octaurelia]|uniref:Casein kinase I n=1 Tax=Paramecium octaurelia TaxID=43137 RepID=A0A8S1S3A4_PAROT|nr:unnamed protein product [Paramecium octaurelia]
MKKLPSSYLEPKIFDNKYIIKQKLSSGSFGIVYLAIHKVTREEVAVKLEKGEQETLDREVYLLTKLQGIQGITKLYWFGSEQNYNVMVIEILGKDLGYYIKHYKQLSLKTGLQLLEQLITIFSFVHNKGIVHRDLKPENIMMGKINSAQAFLVDFGVSKQIFDQGKHIPFRDKKSFIGTTRYASIAAHRGYEIGRKDDLESLMYVIIYLILGKLPWQNLQNIGDKDRTIVVGEVKMQTTISQLCKDLPPAFSEYLNYLKGLKYQDKPDYDLLKKIMRQCSDANTYDNQFEWTDKIQEKSGEPKQQSSFLAVPNGLNDQQRQGTKKQSYMGSQSSNIVKYIPSYQEAIPIKSQPQKIILSQPHIEVLKQIDTVDFDDIEENMKNYPTLEQKLLRLQEFDAKFKDQCISHSAIHVFEH